MPPGINAPEGTGTIIVTLYHYRPKLKSVRLHKNKSCLRLLFQPWKNSPDGLNCLVFPYSRSKATTQLWEKYKSVTELLTEVCRSGQTDPQLYYHLVIQAHLQEEKFSQNADLENWKDFPCLLERCKDQVRNAHREYIAGREDAPAFESGHIV